MKCLTDNECHEYSLRHGVRFEDGAYAGFLREGCYPSSSIPAKIPNVCSAGLQATVPDAPDQQTPIISTFFAACDHANGWLLWLRDWSVWGNDFDDLWAAMRLRFGEHRPIIEAPGHHFERNEKELARDLALLAMLLGWDAYLTSEPASLVLYMSHDAYMELYALDEPRLAKPASILARSGLKIWS